MYQFNDQFSKAATQFADAAANVNRLALENAEKAFGLQLAAIEETVNASFAFTGELLQVRDADGLKAVWPKGVQVARENVERTIGANQEVFGRTLKTNEAIAQIAKGQFETVAAAVQAEGEKVAKAAAPRKAR